MLVLDDALYLGFAVSDLVKSLAVDQFDDDELALRLPNENDVSP